MTTTLARAGSALAAAGLLIGTLSACTPGTDSTPKPTRTAAFTTDEEAFAAAEETYRAYTDAMNTIDLADPSTFDSLYEHSTGDFQTADKETYSELHAEGLRMTGQVRVARFHGVAFDSRTGGVEAQVCVDVSQSDVVDATGESRISPNRADMNPMYVYFETNGDKALIARAERDESIPCDHQP